MRDDFLPVIWRAFSVWLIIVLAESLHGTARVIFLQPVFGDFRARQIAVFSGILIILTIAYFFVGWMRAKNTRQLFFVGLLWVVLTLAFEISLGRLLNLSWTRILSDYDILNGGLMPLGLLFMIFAPLSAAKLRNKFSGRRDLVSG
jgi:hypothetical protein